MRKRVLFSRCWSIDVGYGPDKSSVVRTRRVKDSLDWAELCTAY